MQNTAPKGGAGSDDPTGRDLFGRQDRPAGYLWEGYVRTGSSYANPYQFCPLSAACRLSSRTTSASCSSTARSSFRSCRSGAAGGRSRTRSTVIGGRAAGLGGAVATGGANAGRNSGRKRGLAPRPDRPEAAPDRATPEKAVAGRCCAGRCGAVLDPRRLTVRRQPNGRERLSAAVSRRVRCGADVVRFAVDAVCCGKLGCAVEEPLLSVTVGGDSRVLCPDCAAEFVRGRSQ